MKPLKVMMLGLRGFPGIQGGVETHCAHLCPLLVDLGCEVEVITRSTYQKSTAPWHGVRFTRLWAPKMNGAEALVHSVIGVFYAAIKRPDILHIHAIGPAIVVPLARLLGFLGLHVVVTHHGPDYDRQKWGKLARWVLQTGEWAGMRFSNARIVISKTIAQLVLRKHHVQSQLIPNGVSLPELLPTHTALDAFGLSAGRYIVLVSRLVPEKRHLDLIQAFHAAKLAGWKLVIVGGADHPDDYSRSVNQQASEDVICTGFQSGQALGELLTHAGMFVLPSSHEGLPIALLEALSYGLPVIASDIPANLEVGLTADHYFPLGDTAALAERLRHFAELGALSPAARQQLREWVIARYNWERIAEQTLIVYMQIA